jgi:hypothetical protein
VKLRFIDQFADRLGDPESLRRAVEAGCRRDLASFSRARAWVSRGEGLRALWRTAVAEPSVLTHPWTWRAVGKVLLGPELSARVSGRELGALA